MAGFQDRNLSREDKDPGYKIRLVTENKDHETVQVDVVDDGELSAKLRV
jgi:hypothetical protein